MAQFRIKGKAGPKSIKIGHGLTKEEAKKQEEEINEVLQTIDKSRRKNRRYFLLALVALIVTLVVVHYETVMRYAVLSDLEVIQDPANPTNIKFSHGCERSGRVAYSYDDAELIDYVEEDSEHDWQWNWNPDDDEFTVTVRSRWWIFPTWKSFDFKK